MTMRLIETRTLDTSAASITFNNIPQTYRALRIVASARSTTANSTWLDVNVRLYFNSDNTGANYSMRRLVGTWSTATSGSGAESLYGCISSTNATANTFGSINIDIPNYTSTTEKKAFSAEAIIESNASTPNGDNMRILSSLWSGTSAITSAQLIPDIGSFASGSTFSLYGIGANESTKATGGLVYTDSSYVYHVFKMSGIFTPSQALNCEILSVAGGGGGGRQNAGGGGAGGLRGFTGQVLNPGSYVVSVGAGGAGGATIGTKGSNGSDSIINSLTSTGGGGGGAMNSNIQDLPTSGGSGGGGNGMGSGSGATGAAGNTPSVSPSQGNSGGTGSGNYGGGGGGGATSSGASSVTSTGGNGGTGSSSYSTWGAVTSTGHNVSGTYYYAGGGGGGGTNTKGTGGFGGGGDGGIETPSTLPTSATANTGGGGGGARNNTIAGNGGSGIVIIRYAR